MGHGSGEWLGNRRRHLQWHSACRIFRTDSTTCFSQHDTLLGALEPLRLTHLRIIFSCGRHHDDISFPRDVYDGLRSCKFDRIVWGLPSVMPSLSHIFITSAGRAIGSDQAEVEETWDISRAWRVRRSAPEGMVNVDLEELTAIEREAAIEREELRATERATVSSTLVLSDYRTG